MLAILSDIHANKHALDAVLNYLRSKGITRLGILGDTVGYGANPVECVQTIRELSRVEFQIYGNHDVALRDFSFRHHMNSRALAAITTHEQMMVNAGIELPLSTYTHESNCTGFVHASPSNKKQQQLVEYIEHPDIDPFGTPEIIEQKNNKALDRILKGETPHPNILRWCVGHSHTPLIVRRTTPENTRYTQISFEGDKDKIDERTYKVMSDKPTIVNVGSVGQPRDYDPRACIAVKHGDDFTFVRIPYNIDAQITDLRNLDEKIPDLLRESPDLISHAHDWITFQTERISRGN